MAEVIKTIGAVGADYTTLTAFWTARSSNAGAGDVYIAELIDAADYPWGEVSGTFAGSVLIRPATAVKLDLTNPTLPHAKITSSTTSSLYYRSLAPLVLEDLEFFTSFSASNLRLAAFEDTNVIIRRCLVRGGSTGIFHGRSTGETLVENCVVTEATTWGISNGFAGITVRNTVVVDNNTSNTASRAGLRKDIAGCVLENVVSFGNGLNDFFGASTLSTVSYLASGNTSASGSNALTGVTSAAFTNYAAENYTAAVGGVLDGTAAGGADRGLNLSSADIIAITSPVDWQMFARNKVTNTGSIPITGTYSGGTVPASMEARWNGGVWTTIVASPTGGTFSGTLTGLTSGNGTLEVRYSNATAITDSVDNVAIGAKLLFWGQSNFSGRATNPQTYTGTAGFFHKYTVTNSVWQQGADPFDTDTATGSLFPLLANQLVAQLGCPVAFIGVASGSTTLAQWQSGQTLNTRMLNYISNAAPDGLESICSWIGESDASGATPEADYKSRYNSVIDQLKAVTGVNSMLVAISGLANTDYANVRQWVNDIAATNPNALDTVPQIWPLYQKIHYETNTETADAANAIFNGINTNFYPPPPVNWSVASTLPLITSTGTLTSVVPSYNTTVISTLPKLLSGMVLGLATPSYNTSIVSTLPLVSSNATLSFTPTPQYTISLTGNLPKVMSTVLITSGFTPEHNVGVNSTLPKISSSASVTFIVPEYSSSIIGTLPKVSSSLSLNTQGLTYHIPNGNMIFIKLSNNTITL